MPVLRSFRFLCRRQEINQVAKVQHYHEQHRGARKRGLHEEIRAHVDQVGRGADRRGKKQSSPSVEELGLHAVGERPAGDREADREGMSVVMEDLARQAMRDSEDDSWYEGLAIGEISEGWGEEWVEGEQTAEAEAETER